MSVLNQAVKPLDRNTYRVLKYIYNILLLIYSGGIMASWLIPCSPSIYDAEAAFSEYGNIIWHQQCNMLPGDIAYIYVSAPVKQIRCKCLVEAVDIPFDIGEDEGYTLDEAFCSKTYRRYMDLKLLECYDSPLLSYQMLLMNGLNGPIRSQRRVTPQLESYLASVSNDRRAKRNADD